MRLDDAYANAAHIPNGMAYPERWAAAAGAYRATHRSAELGVPYGNGARHWYDMFGCADATGTLVFVHGGYWKAFGPRDFSHLAAGGNAAGLNVAMPCYTLAPEARISDITKEIAAAISVIATATDGPLYLVGHSAGGHLVARMACEDMKQDWRARVARVMPISPVAELAPLMQTSMNEDLCIDLAEAATESPSRQPAPPVPVHVWVGAVERPAFLEQAQVLAQAWDAPLTLAAQRHHFDVIEDLKTAGSELMKALLA